MRIIYDGSFESFIKALKIALEYNDAIISKEENLFDENIYINKTSNDIEIDKELYFDILIIYLSEVQGFENIALRYLREKINGNKNILNDNIKKVIDIKRKFFRELHKYKGFTRFYEVDKNLMFSKIMPENNIVYFLANFFKKRIQQDFVIYDEKRKIGAFKKGNEIYIEKIDEIKFKVSEKEKEIITLWKGFLKDITIKERVNLKLQKNFVPLKYRRNMIEFLA